MPLIRAVANQALDSYPPWVIGPFGRERLGSISQYENELDPALVQRYRTGEAMLRFTPYNRIYCSHPHSEGENELCNWFISGRAERTARHQWRDCPRCDQPVCRACGRPQTAQNLRAACELTDDMRDMELERRSEDRGFGFQLCPECKFPDWRRLPIKLENLSSSVKMIAGREVHTRDVC